MAITEEQVQTSLSQSNIHICPHLRTTDARVRERLVRLLEGQPGKRPAGAFAGAKESCEVASACETCGASFVLSRLAGGAHLLLSVRREVHKLRDRDIHERDNVDVLINLEDCGQVCCVYMGTGNCYAGYHWLLAEDGGQMRRL